MEKLSCLSASNTQEEPNNANLRDLPFNLKGIPLTPQWTVKAHKVRMLLSLPNSSEELMKGFKSKLRSQIKRPQNAGFSDKLGGGELLDDFYRVFSLNMRDLGSPVHSKALFQKIFKCFSDRTKIILVYNQDEPIAGSIILKFKDTVANPWASALRKYSRDSPNMMLYWRMLSHAADEGYKFFDFGRSTPSEGTYRFKTQWGAKPYTMYWYSLYLNSSKYIEATDEDGSGGRKRELVENFWQRLPEPVARMLGPMIRKHIEL
jgi:FemAB-related protein (PEP-CTERM system-associated)